MDFSDFIPTEEYSADNEGEEENTAETNKEEGKIRKEPVNTRPLGVRTMTQVKKITKRKET